MNVDQTGYPGGMRHEQILLLRGATSVAASVQTRLERMLGISSR